jgi:hypothetical protein
MRVEALGGCKPTINAFLRGKQKNPMILLHKISPSVSILREGGRSSDFTLALLDSTFLTTPAICGLEYILVSISLEFIASS